jgi:hypothetical protein
MRCRFFQQSFLLAKKKMIRIECNPEKQPDLVEAYFARGEGSPIGMYEGQPMHVCGMSGNHSNNDQ